MDVSVTGLKKHVAVTAGINLWLPTLLKKKSWGGGGGKQANTNKQPEQFVNLFENLLKLYKNSELYTKGREVT